jgi:hypothetical protein
MVERFNRTLKTMIRKQVDRFGKQWDRFLSGLLWSYRNTPHETTGEKPSYLLFGFDCRSPSEASYLPNTPIEATELEDYREQLALSLTSARELAADTMRRSQQRYKNQYDWKVTNHQFRIGDWVMVKFPKEESGKLRKLSRPWHGPYRILSIDGPDVTVVKVYFPGESQIQVHQSRVSLCPENFPACYYWYGKNRKGPGVLPTWANKLIVQCTRESDRDTEGQPIEEERQVVEEGLDGEDRQTVERDIAIPNSVKSSRGSDHTLVWKPTESGYSLRKVVRWPARYD